MASSWRYGKRSKYRTKVSQDPEDFYRLDPKKSPTKNAYDIYTELCCRDTRDTKRLFLLNGLATLSQQQHQLQQQQGKSNLGFSTEELLYCLSASLIHTFTQVRAAALRTIRYALHTPKDIKIFNSLQLQHLLVRSIDLVLRNDDERVQAVKLIRKMLAISAEDISPVLVRCLVSLADSGIEDGDNMLRACLATLCEFAVLNPTLLIVCGGVTSITRNVLECHNPRIAESLCGVLLYLLEWPQTRNISGVRLDCLAAPYCDFTYRLGIMDKNKDARELRYTSCRLALLSVLRSWTGTIEFCDPSKPSGLKAIVDALYLNQLEVRKAILDLLFELLGLPQPAWTDDYDVALQTVDPADFQDAWLLSNGFVAMEGRSILPSLAARAANVCEQHLSLLLYCFLETGLLNALVEVIVSADSHISVRATVLIGKLLHLMHTHLPPDICSTSPALPTLLTHATQGNQHATAAISALRSYQQMLRNRPAACSLFLDSIIQSGTLIHTRLFRRDINAQDVPTVAAGIVGGDTLDRPRLDSVSSSDESMSQASSSLRSSFRLKRKLLPFFENLRVNRLIKDSNVLSLPDGNAWDWEVVTTILRSNLIRKMDDSAGKFLKRLVHYFKPSSNRFSHQDLVHTGRSLPAYVTAGLDLIDWLLASYPLESMRLLTDLFSDISQHLLAVTTSNRAHDCLFSPQHMNNTMCQQYFLYIGRMCRVQKGISILTNTAVFEHLVNLVRNTDHVCYVKLIVSGLDYSLESVTRKVLEKALTASKTRTGRLYATQFLAVLLRARIPNFEVWGIPMIIQQTRDPDRSVVLAAMDVLEEACHEKYYLEEIVSLWPNLKSLGDVGRLLTARYYSLSRGLNHRKARIKEEIEYWKHGYNKRYVLLIEADTHSSLTLHIRNEEGYYSRRNCSTRPIVVPPNIPPHIYGQMVQTTQGTTALRKYGDLQYLLEVVNRSKCTDDVECLELKAAIWAIGHASTHSNGIEFFAESGTRVYEKLVILATKCEVYSIRATCFNVLGLIAGTNDGANVLFKLNWLSVRHDRNTIWPVHQPEDWMSSNYTPVRHYYEEMPPYNYTGIEDQIDGSFCTGSYWNLLLSSSSATHKESVVTVSSRAEQQDVLNTTADSSKTGAETELVTAAAKSRTLPEGTYAMRHAKHQRSLSESKTSDVISLIGGGAVGGAVGSVYHHRIRYNSCTDSNTSGVSSCESVTGGRATATVGEFQQVPLSPIPSMSNLMDIMPQPGLLRRTSLIGTSFFQNAISPIDIKGYAQLRSLRRHCRPVLSESATDLYDIIDRKDLLSYASFRPRKSSWGESQRRIKVRSLDRQSSLRMFTQLDSEELQVPLPTLAPPKFLSQNDSKGPCYTGICLPKNLLDLFPTRNLTRTYVSRDIQDQDLMDINLLTAKQQYLNDSLNNEGDESSIISSLSDVSSVSKRSKWLGTKHGRGNCLHCTRSLRNPQHPHRLGSDTNLLSTTTALVATAAAAAVARKSSKTNQSSCIQLSDISFNSPESILSEESMPDRLTANILHHVQRLANPVSAKQSKMALLEVKQKHPNSFQDICLYSEVCKSLGRSSYRMTARRFLQELFLDLNFDTFYVEPLDIINKKGKEIDGTIALMDVAGVEATRLEKRLTASDTGSASDGASSSANLGNVMSTVASHTSTHKSHIKHLHAQPALASVYETSCENLLVEQASPLPPLGLVKTPETAQTSKRSSRTQARISTTPTARSSSCSSSSNTSSTTPRFIGHQAPSFQNELHIGSEDDEDEPNADDDEVDCVLRPQHQVAYTQYNNINITNTTSSTVVQRNATPLSYISDQTTNSNRSSICTISNQPSSTAPTTLENENKKYTRGRFYTLELDLSCTKNKFPITERRRTTSAANESAAALAMVVTSASTSTTASRKSCSPTPALQQPRKLQRPLSLGSNIVTHTATSSSVICGLAAAESTSSNACAIPRRNSELQPLPVSLTTAPITITKSLAASLAKPIGSLYCEKRLQSSKSEAVLTNATAITTLPKLLSTVAVAAKKTGLAAPPNKSTINNVAAVTKT